MDRTKLYFEWYNIRECELSNYEKLVFYNLVGHFATESIPHGETLVTVELKKESNPSSTDKIYITCNGVNVELIKEYFKGFPFMTDINFLSKEGYSGVMVNRKKLNIKPVVVQEISYINI